MEKVVGEDDSPQLAAGETVLDEVIDAALHRLAHLSAAPSAKGGMVSRKASSRRPDPGGRQKECRWKSLWR